MIYAESILGAKLKLLRKSNCAISCIFECVYKTFLVFKTTLCMCFSLCFKSLKYSYIDSLLTIETVFQK